MTREAITRKQERAFLEFVASDKHFCKYYDGIYILFKTGLRISEFVGLTLADVDMKNRKININHQLQRKRNMEYIIEGTKTSSGTRVIPMTDDVYECFKRIIANRKKPKVEPMICGKSGFLYLDKKVCRWWPCIGKSISSIFARSITASIKYRCRRSRRTFADIRSARTWQKAE